MLDNLIRINRQNEYLLFFNEDLFVERYSSSPNTQSIVLRSKSKLLWDQVLVPLAARNHRCDVILNTKQSVPLITSCRTIFVMHGADWIAYPQNFYFLDRIYHTIFLPLYCTKADRIISVSNHTTELTTARLKVNSKKLRTILSRF